jgi:aspartyl-tRNA(Asn)/glutamyl-tRNA(Gln) amidotransferase subunit C
MISRDEVKKLAELSLLAVDEKELDTLTGEIDSILGYISEVDSFTTEGKGEENEKPQLYNVFRDDVVLNKEGEYTERILEEAPLRDGDYLCVKKIL